MKLLSNLFSKKRDIKLIVSKNGRTINVYDCVSLEHANQLANQLYKAGLMFEIKAAYK